MFRHLKIRILKILTAGGAGFVGTNFIKYLLKKYPSYLVVNLDSLVTGDAANLAEFEGKENYRFVQGNICDEDLVEKLFNEESFDAVVNLASEITPESFIKTDVYGNFILLEAARKAEVKRFVFVSSDEVYGETETEEGLLRPSTEEDPLRPQVPQAAGKAGADVLTFSYNKAFSLPTVILRPSNIYGPFQSKDKLLPLLIENALSGKPLPIYGDGKHSRDFLYVKDFCEALDISLHFPDAIGQTFNVSGGFEHTILEITELVLTILGKSKDLIEFVEDTNPHTRRRALDATKIKEVLGWEAKVNFADGLTETCHWQQEKLGS